VNVGQNATFFYLVAGETRHEASRAVSQHPNTSYSVVFNGQNGGNR
jgi:hypothetical protein